MLSVNEPCLEGEWRWNLGKMPAPLDRLRSCLQIGPDIGQNPTVLVLVDFLCLSLARLRRRGHEPGA